MRTIKLSEKQNNLKHFIEMLKPQNAELEFKEDQMSREQRSSQNSPKVFINEEEAYIWIKKDFDKKTRQDLLDIIKKKAQKQLTIQKITYLNVGGIKNRKNVANPFRNYSTTTTNRFFKDFRYSSNDKTVNLTQKSDYSEIKQPFLSIRTIEKLQKLPTSQNSSRKKMRTRTEKCRDENSDFNRLPNSLNMHETAAPQENRRQMKRKQRQRIQNNVKYMEWISKSGLGKSLGKIHKSSKVSQQQSFQQQYLTPW